MDPQGAFFFLLQSEEGDLYKVTIEHDEQDVRAVKIKYFDTVPVATSLCILKSGFLFVAAEFGNQYVHIFDCTSSYFDSACSHLYQFLKLGDEGEEFSSTDYALNGMADPGVPLPHVTFCPRPLENLALVDEMQSLDPIIDSKVANLLPDAATPQIFTACGRGHRSTFRTLRYGLEVEESVREDLGAIPRAIWTTKLRKDGRHYVFLSLSLHRSDGSPQMNTTLILFCRLSTVR